MQGQGHAYPDLRFCPGAEQAPSAPGIAERHVAENDPRVGRDAAACL